MIEILTPRKLHDKGRRVLEAFAAGCSVPFGWADRFSGNNEMCVTWGPGAPEQQAALRKSKLIGCRFVAFDLGYWDRIGSERHLRVTVDNGHPQAFVMRRDEPESRFDRAKIELRNDSADGGHVILVGMGEKSRQQLTTTGRPVTELDMLRKILASPVYGKRHIVYRPKGSSRERLQGCETINRDSQSIEKLLNGAGLVVTRHSNVAIDAIIAGVPAVCWDGAAAAVLGSDLSKPVYRLPDETRLRFLRNLAWWQWTEAELRNGSMWRWLKSWI